MNKASLYLLITCITGFVTFKTANAASIEMQCSYYSIDTICCDSGCIQKNVAVQQILPFNADNPKKKKLICALFSIPFPFGFVGAHRVMLGTSPWVPVVYMATLGGCFGVLPLIDFCFITFSKDLTPYENNPHFFMWVK